MEGSTVEQHKRARELVACPACHADKGQACKRWHGADGNGFRKRRGYRLSWYVHDLRLARLALKEGL